MSTAIATIMPTGFNPDQVALIKRTVAKGTSDDELAMFLQVAQRTGLDPFTKQIYAIMRWDSKLDRNVMSIQVGIDGMRATADRTECYAPGRETVFEYKGDDIFKATAFVKKLSHGVWHEVAESAHMAEYRQSSPMWSKLPHVMLAKCAEARALRRAFPMQLSGIYAREEMGTDDSVDAVVEPATPQPKQLAQAPAVVDFPMGETPKATTSVLEQQLEASIKAKEQEAFDAVNNRLHKLPGYMGDDGKAARKEWWAGILGFSTTGKYPVGPRWSPYTPYTRSDAATKQRVADELAKLEASAADAMPEFTATPAEPVRERVVGEEG